MTAEQKIIANADAVLIAKCKFSGVEIATLTSGLAHEKRGPNEKDRQSQVFHEPGQLRCQEEVFGDGGVRIRFEFRDEKVSEIKVYAKNAYSEACREWIHTVEAGIPNAKIIFEDLAE